MPKYRIPAQLIDGVRWSLGLHPPLTTRRDVMPCLTSMPISLHEVCLGIWHYNNNHLSAIPIYCVGLDGDIKYVLTYRLPTFTDTNEQKD